MKNILIACLFISLPFLSIAQFWEGGLYGGISYYNGDMSTRLIDSKQLQPAVGAFLRYNPLDALSVRVSGGWARTASDMANTNPDYQYYEAFLDHNLSFRTTIIEAAVMAEWNILGFDPYNLRKTFTPYIFAGIGGFYYNPKAEYENEWHALRELGTEGQGMDGYDDYYSKLSLAIPFGLGVKLAVNDIWNIGIDWGARYTFTDYLDDASTVYVSRPELLAGGKSELAANLANRMGEYRGSEPVIVETGTRRGNAESKDFYTFLVLTVSYNFMDNGLVGFRRKNSRRSACPTNF